MPNLTYGTINAKDGSINAGGTDLIATTDGVASSYDPGDIAWVLTCSALVWLMIPGLGYLYSGLVRRKNALSLLFMTMASLAVTSFQWFFWGYSLTFSKTGGLFWGNLRNFAFIKVLELPVPEANNKIPEIVFAIYQSLFAALVPAVALGAAAERSRFLPAMVFTFMWTTLVYDPLAHWVWSSNGWAYKWGVLDYAGGVPIEIASGVTGLAYSYFIGPRRGGGTMFKPQNISHVVLGTVLLWVGWLGFNGGSTFAANLRAAMAIYTTNLAGSVGGITWMVMDYRLERKWSCIGFCTGAICGLVAITPAAGFVGAPAALLIGFLASVVSNLATRLKNVMRVDDPLDIFACHALSGVVGTLLTGIFAEAKFASLDGYSVIRGGWLNGNFRQLGLQTAWVCVGMGWSFVVTYAVMFVINLVPGLHFKSSEQAEIVGMDETEHDEFVQDFVSFRRDADLTVAAARSLHRVPSSIHRAPSSLYRSPSHDPQFDTRRDNRHANGDEKRVERGRGCSKQSSVTEVNSSDENKEAHDRQSNGLAKAPSTLRMRSQSRARSLKVEETVEMDRLKR